MPAITALNMRLRDDYVADAKSGVERWWNRIIARAGYDYRLKLPHVAFHRHIGEFAAIHADPDGKMLSDDEWQRRRGEFLPSRDDDAYVASLMRPGHRTRRLRLVDRPAARRHRRQARQFRICEAGGVNEFAADGSLPHRGRGAVPVRDRRRPI